MVSGDPEGSQGVCWRALEVDEREKSTKRFGSYLAMVTSIRDSEPTTFVQEANQQVWREAMQEEYDSIMCNDVWEVVPRPRGEVNGDFQVVVQDQVCCIWHH
jgi:hypothetical protein